MATDGCGPIPRRSADNRGTGGARASAPGEPARPNSTWREPGSPLALCRRLGDERAHHGCPRPRRPRPRRGAAAPTPEPGASFGSWEPVPQQRLHDTTQVTRAAAHTESFDSLERYDKQRRHSALGYLRPRAFEREHELDAAALNPGVYHPGQVQPPEGRLAPRAGQTGAFLRPTTRGDGLVHSSDANVQCPL